MKIKFDLLGINIYAHYTYNGGVECDAPHYIFTYIHSVISGSEYDTLPEYAKKMYKKSGKASVYIRERDTYIICPDCERLLK